MARTQPASLLAAQASAVDLAAEQPAARRAKNGSQRAVPAAGEFVADERARRGPHDEARRPVGATAVVAAVVAAPDMVAAADLTWLVISAPPVVDRRLLGPPPVRGRPRRRVRQGCGGDGDGAGDDGEQQLTHIEILRVSVDV